MSIKQVQDWVRHRDTSLFQVVACQGNEPTDADVAAFETGCGLRLPSEFRDFMMSPLGGLYVEAREEVWPRAKEFDVGPFWSFLYAVKVFGIAADIPDWLDIRVQHAWLRDEGYAGLVPFLQIQGDANRYCFNSAGAIVYWDHEEPDDQAIVQESFGDLLIRELRDLEQRTQRRLTGEHL